MRAKKRSTVHGEPARLFVANRTHEPASLFRVRPAFAQRDRDTLWRTSVARRRDWFRFATIESFGELSFPLGRFVLLIPNRARQRGEFIIERKLLCNHCLCST